MSTKESERVDAHRRNNFDRISVLVEKGGRELFRVLAIREDCSMTEMIRRAVLARAGLRVLPYSDQLAELEAVETHKDACTAVKRLQNKDAADEIINNLVQELGGEANGADYSVTIDSAEAHEIQEALRKIGDAIRATPAADAPATIALKGRDVGAIRRMLANIEPQYHDEI